jgi:hypothetical protein
MMSLTALAYGGGVSDYSFDDSFNSDWCQVPAGSVVSALQAIGAAGLGTTGRSAAVELEFSLMSCRCTRRWCWNGSLLGILSLHFWCKC